MIELVSRGTLTTVPYEPVLGTVADGPEAACDAASSPAASRHAPASRTRSRTSAATDAHGTGCAASAPASKDPLTDNAIFARIDLSHSTSVLSRDWPDQCVHPAQNIRRQFWDNFECLHVLANLLDLCGPGDHGADMRIRKTPCKRQLRQRARQLFRYRLQ